MVFMDPFVVPSPQPFAHCNLSGEGLVEMTIGVAGAIPSSPTLATPQAPFRWKEESPLGAGRRESGWRQGWFRPPPLSQYMGRKVGDEGLSLSLAADTACALGGADGAAC